MRIDKEYLQAVTQAKVLKNGLNVYVKPTLVV